MAGAFVNNPETVKTKAVYGNFISQKKVVKDSILAPRDPNVIRERTANKSFGNPYVVGANQNAQVCFGTANVLRHNIRNMTAGNLFFGYNSSVSASNYEGLLLPNEAAQIEGSKNIFVFSVGGGTVVAGSEAIE